MDGSRPAGLPRWRSIAFDGPGLGDSSPVSNAKLSSIRAFARRAPGVSPRSQASNSSTKSGVTQWLATLMTPTAPTASSGSVKLSSPLYTSKPSPAAAISRAVSAGFPVASFTPTTLATS